MTELSPAPSLHSRKVQTNREAIIPPGALPWDEELVTFSRDQGKMLAFAQRENLNLRQQLKDLNRKLDREIEETKAKREAKPAHVPRNTLTEELKSAQSHLANTEKEYSRMKARFELLSERNYMETLIDTVEKQAEKVKKLEQLRIQLLQTQTKREKVLGTVLETGETPEMAKEVGQQLKELEVLGIKVRQLEQEGRRSATAYEKIVARSEKLTAEAAKLMAEIGEIPEESDKSTEIAFETVKKEADSQTIQQKSTISKLKTRIFQLQTDLQSLTQSRDQLSRQIQEKSVNIGLSAAEIKDLQPLSKQSSAKIIHQQRSKSTSRRVAEGGNTFLTEMK
jgi:RNA-binding protein YhbY